MTSTSSLRARPLALLITLVAVALAVSGCGLQGPGAVARVAELVGTGATPRTELVYQPIGAAAARRATPAIKHVFVINMENESIKSTYGAASVAPYVAKTLRDKAVFLSGYDGVAHNSLPNYIAEISGQGPNAMTQADCQIFMDFAATTTISPGQAVGQGCVYPTSVSSLPVQMSAAHHTWKGYMDDMKTDCQHPVLNQQDHTQAATATAEYAARHNPFMYFHGVIDDDAYCKAHVVPLTDISKDLKKASTTPNLSFITPDLCDDGHDAPCADGRPGGLKSVNDFMKVWVPKILASPAFKKDGMLVITTDESATSDTAAPAGTQAPPNTPMAGITGPGGGNIGTLVISRFTRPGTSSTTPYNHYSLLASIEAIFGLKTIGYASVVTPFGPDVYNATKAHAVTNTAPIARIQVKPSTMRVGRHQQVRFLADASSDTQTPRSLRYSWNFFNGGRTTDARGRRVSHHWKHAGRHRVTLTVTDPSGLKSRRTIYITVTRKSAVPDGHGHPAGSPRTH